MLKKIKMEIFNCNLCSKSKKLKFNELKNFDNEFLRRISRITSSDIEYQIDFKNDKFRLRIENSEPITFSKLFGNLEECKYYVKRLSYCKNNNIELLLEKWKNACELEINEINGIIII